MTLEFVPWDVVIYLGETTGIVAEVVPIETSNTANARLRTLGPCTAVLRKEQAAIYALAEISP